MVTYKVYDKSKKYSIKIYFTHNVDFKGLMNFPIYPIHIYIRGGDGHKSKCAIGGFGLYHCSPTVFIFFFHVHKEVSILNRFLLHSMSNQILSHSFRQVYVSLANCTELDLLFNPNR